MLFLIMVKVKASPVREHPLSHKKIVIIATVIPYNGMHPLFHTVSFLLVLEKLFLSKQDGRNVDNRGRDT